MNLEWLDPFAIPLLGTPIMVALAWWTWSRRNPTLLTQWRAVALIIGLVAVSADATTYYGWFAYRMVANGSELTWRVKDWLGDNLGIYLALAALASAAVGKGSTRILIAIAAAMELVLWSRIGIL